ncbi:glycosyltransferase [Kineosporia succinea]|uniref:Glycosyltransferase involved in cell wall biosynthesis n=1 Tax=Kineosporia succinea TaxID=84632 RepID=A0ABT9PBP5_9ACTN|nr:glycosyltransferase [Kineosporia succinea]MDP9830127.1 glycosyltransferase involved in cell wall biosynthesis [Kineosporia succinea]
MRVALLAHLHHPIAEPYAGGLEMHTALVADELVRRGHDVTLFAREHSRTRARLVPVLDGQRGPSRALRTPDHVLDQGLARAIEEVESGDFDVVLNNSLNPQPYTELHHRAVLTLLHTPPTLERVNAIIDDPAWRPGPRHAFAAVSRYNARAWRTRLPNVGCVTNGINLSHWRPSMKPEPDLAIWSARITPEKGLHLAIDAARGAGMRLEISGPVADREYFDECIAPRLGPDTILRGLLNHRELAAVSARAAVFLATPLWDEPFGLAMVEAMACGTPVAALPNGACPEVVLPTGGFVAARPTAGALATAIAEARTLDRARVHRHAQRFDARIMLDRYEDVLSRLAAQPAPLPEPLTA